jgi:hypothetical protein
LEIIPFGGLTLAMADEEFAFSFLMFVAVHLVSFRWRVFTGSSIKQLSPLSFVWVDHLVVPGE